MTLQDVLLLSGLLLVLSIAAHWFIHRYLIAVVVSSAAWSFCTVGGAVLLSDHPIKPSAVVFWIPGMLYIYTVLTSPFAALVGIPFYVVRRRRWSNAAMGGDAGSTPPVA